MVHDDEKNDDGAPRQAVNKVTYAHNDSVERGHNKELDLIGLERSKVVPRVQSGACGQRSTIGPASTASKDTPPPTLPHHAPPTMHPEGDATRRGRDVQVCCSISENSAAPARTSWAVAETVTLACSAHLRMFSMVALNSSMACAYAMDRSTNFSAAVKVTVACFSASSVYRFSVVQHAWPSAGTGKWRIAASH